MQLPRFRSIVLRNLLVVSVMTMGLVAVPAQACQLICLPTVATYDGNLGGWSGADAKCAAEYPGFKLARSMGLIYNAFNAPTNIATSMLFGNTGGYIWGGNFSGGGNSNNYSCNNWTYNGGSGPPYGATVYNPGGGNISANYNSCSTLYALMCCNM